MSEVSKEIWQLIVSKSCIPNGLELLCAGVNLTLFFNPKERGEHTAEKWQIYGCWSIHSFVLYPPETLRVKDLRGAEHFFLSSCRPATGNWRVEISPATYIQFEKTHLYHTDATPNFKQKGTGVLQLLSQRSHYEVVSTADRGIEAQSKNLHSLIRNTET